MQKQVDQLRESVYQQLRVRELMSPDSSVCKSLPSHPLPSHQHPSHRHPTHQHPSHQHPSQQPPHLNVSDQSYPRVKNLSQFDADQGEMREREVEDRGGVESVDTRVSNPYQLVPDCMWCVILSSVSLTASSPTPQEFSHHHVHHSPFLPPIDPFPRHRSPQHPTVQHNANDDRPLPALVKRYAGIALEAMLPLSHLRSFHNHTSQSTLQDESVIHTEKKTFKCSSPIAERIITLYRSGGNF